MRDAVDERGLERRGAGLTGAFGRDYLDASLLLMPRIGFVDANDPRMRATYDRIVERLAEGPSPPLRVRRRRIQWSGRRIHSVLLLGGGISGATGRRRRGARAMETLLDSGNDLGLFSEEIDPQSRRASRQFPAGLLAHKPHRRRADDRRERRRGARRGAAAMNAFLALAAALGPVLIWGLSRHGAMATCWRARSFSASPA